MFLFFIEAPMEKAILESIDNIKCGKSLDSSFFEIFNILSDKKNVLIVNNKLAFKIFSKVGTNNYFLELIRINIGKFNKDEFFGKKTIEPDTKNQELKKIINLSMIGFLYISSDDTNDLYNHGFIKDALSIFYLWREELNYKYSINDIIFFLLIQIISNGDIMVKFSNLPTSIHNNRYNFYHTSQHTAVQISKVFFLSINFSNTLKYTFNIANNKIENNENFDVKNIASSIHGGLIKTYGTINSIKEWRESNERCENQQFNLILSTLSSENQDIIYKMLIFIVKDIQYIEKEDFNTEDNLNIYINKIESLVSGYEKIDEQARDNLNYFSGNKGSNSNYLDKIYLITTKLMSVCYTVVKSNNKVWIKSVFIREFLIWVSEVNSVINKYDMIDDWNEIEHLLSEESDTVEWKGSFYTSLEKQDSGFTKGNFKKIGTTIISMANSGGGNILVGLIENPELVEDKYKINKKGDNYFYDIFDDFKEGESTEDKIIRRIQDNIKNDSKKNISDFDHLFKMIPISIYIKDKNILLYKIKVFQSEKPLYTITKDKYLSIRKRVTGRNDEVLPTFE